MDNNLKEKGKQQGSAAFLSTILFLVLIFTISIAAFFTPFRAFSENENRFLAKKPEFSADALFSGEYTMEYEEYITDQFVQRDRWIGLKTQTERLLLKQDINGVYFGKDGYLIEKHSSNDIDSVQAEKNLKRLAEFLYNYSEEYGSTHVKAMLIPTASEILTDKLPPFASGYPQEELLEALQTEIDKLFVKSSSASAGTSILINTKKLLQEHMEEYIYYRTDHHWTSLGAYYAYRQWADANGITPFMEEDYDIQTVSSDFYGTIYSKVNVNVIPDEIRLYYQKVHGSYTLNFNNGESSQNSLYDMKQLKGKDKYSVFLGGNNALVQVKGENKNGRKLLVVKDSFAHSFVPFAAAHFEETIMVDLRYFNMSLSEFAEEHDITDVLVLYNIINFAKDKNSIKLLK